MEQPNPKDDAAVRFVAVIIGSAVLMLIWFSFYPVSALVCSTFAIVVSILCVWPPHLPAKTNETLRQKLHD